MHDKADQKTNRVGDDVTLAALDPFPGIIAANPATFSGFHAPAVNHTRCQAGLPTSHLTRERNQTVIEFDKQAAAAPVMEMHQSWKYRRTVETGGKSLGSIRHWHPNVAR